jgi:hypothetical protein
MIFLPASGSPSASALDAIVHQAEDDAGHARRWLDIPEGTCFASDKGPVRFCDSEFQPDRSSDAGGDGGSADRLGPARQMPARRATRVDPAIPLRTE